MNLDKTIELLSAQIAEAEALDKLGRISNGDPNGQFPFIYMKKIEELFCDCGIQIKKPDGTYRSFYDVLSDMSHVWHELRDVGKDD